jgi:hypothetical protein
MRSWVEFRMLAVVFKLREERVCMATRVAVDHPQGKKKFGLVYRMFLAGADSCVYQGS